MPAETPISLSTIKHDAPAITLGEADLEALYSELRLARGCAHILGQLADPGHDLGKLDPELMALESVFRHQVEILGRIEDMLARAAQRAN